MNWGSLDNFLAMGGYALYVWGSYGMTALCIAAEVWLLARRARRAQSARAPFVARPGEAA